MRSQLWGRVQPVDSHRTGGRGTGRIRLVRKSRADEPEPEVEERVVDPVEHVLPAFGIVAERALLRKKAEVDKPFKGVGKFGRLDVQPEGDFGEPASSLSDDGEDGCRPDRIGHVVEKEKCSSFFRTTRGEKISRRSVSTKGARPPSSSQ